MTRLLRGLLIVALVGGGAISAWAGNARKVNFPFPSVVNGKSIPVGHLTVKWESHSPTATVTFLNDKTVLATAPAKWEDRGKKYSSDAVVFDTQPDGSLVIREIRLAGMSQALVFTP